VVVLVDLSGTVRYYFLFYILGIPQRIRVRRNLASADAVANAGSDSLGGEPSRKGRLRAI